jgi:hypothetical protein
MHYSPGENYLTLNAGSEKKQSKFILTTQQAPLFHLFPSPTTLL